MCDFNIFDILSFSAAVVGIVVGIKMSYWVVSKDKKTRFFNEFEKRYSEIFNLNNLKILEDFFAAKYSKKKKYDDEKIGEIFRKFSSFILYIEEEKQLVKKELKKRKKEDKKQEKWVKKSIPQNQLEKVMKLLSEMECKNIDWKKDYNFKNVFENWTCFAVIIQNFAYSNKILKNQKKKEEELLDSFNDIYEGNWVSIGDKILAISTSGELFRNLKFSKELSLKDEKRN